MSGSLGLIILVAVAAALAGALVSYFLVAGRARARGRDEGRREVEDRVRAAARALARGLRPDDAPPGSPEAEIFQALERGWAPREAERRQALQEAVGRVSAFLAANVRAPLAGAAPDADAAELRERIARALGALQDVDFFLQAPDAERRAVDVVPLVRQVTREFASDHEVGVRLQLDEPVLRASVADQVFMDALYLILHNAARFGGGRTIDVTVKTSDQRARVVVRDRGEGFSEEAFRRAFDPFYSTSPEGLGLGLPHARLLVEEMGGAIEIRNVPDGGAEVEVSFPRA